MLCIAGHRGTSASGLAEAVAARYEYTYAITDFAAGPDPCAIVAVVNANPGVAGPIADSDPTVEPWIVKITSPAFAE